MEHPEQSRVPARESTRQQRRITLANQPVFAHFCHVGRSHLCSALWHPFSRQRPKLLSPHQSWKSFTFPFLPGFFSDHWQTTHIRCCLQCIPVISCFRKSWSFRMKDSTPTKPYSEADFLVHLTRLPAACSALGKRMLCLSDRRKKAVPRDS